MCCFDPCAAVAALWRHWWRHLCLVAVVVPRLHAQDPAPFHLADLLRDVAARNPRVAAARALARAATQRVSSAARPPDPEVQLGVMNRSLPTLRPMDPLGMVQLQVMQMIPGRGKLHDASRAAKEDARAADTRIDEANWEARAAAAMAWYDFYAATRALEIARTSFPLLHEARQVATAMYRVGEGRQADVLRAGVAIARLEADTVRMHAMHLSMAARLNALRDAESMAAPGTPVLPDFPTEVPPLESLVARLEQSPAIRAGQFTVSAAGHREALARREVWPDLTVGVQFGQQRAGMPPTLADDGSWMPGERRRERMASLMIGASLPVFAGQRQHRMRDEAIAMSQMAAADLRAMRAAARARVTETHATLASAHQLMTLFRTSLLPQAQATAVAAAAAYRVGSVDFMALLDSQLALNELHEQLARSEADAGRAWAELEMLTASILVPLSSGGAP